MNDYTALADKLQAALDQGADEIKADMRPPPGSKHKSIRMDLDRDQAGFLIRWLRAEAIKDG